MFSADTNSYKHGLLSTDQAENLALSALVWVLQQPDRAARLLDLTGLTPAGLRANAGDPATLAAVLGFLEQHEPDLVACAAAIDQPPALLIRAREVLES